MKNPAKTGHLVDNQGYVSVGTPNLEKWLDSVTIWPDGSAPVARCLSKSLPTHKEWLRKRLGLGACLSWKFEGGLKMPEQARSATGLDAVFSAKKEFNQSGIKVSQPAHL